MSQAYQWLLTLEHEEHREAHRQLSYAMDQTEKNNFKHLWEYQARAGQLPPPGDWRIWMLMAGRRFGKIRSGPEWVCMIADADPDARIALVSSSLAEARAVIVEGESGLLAISRSGHRPHYEPSLHRIRFANGAQAQLFSRPSRKTCAGRSTAKADSKAQKELFVNQALCLLDALHLHTVKASQSAPPAIALESDFFRVKGPATGACVGREDRVAAFVAGNMH